MKHPRLPAIAALAAAALLIGPLGASATCPDSNDGRAQLSQAVTVSAGDARATTGFGGSGSNRAGNDSQGMARGYGAGEASLPGGNRWSDGMPLVW